MIDSLLHWFGQQDLLAAFADPLDRQRYLAGFGYTLLLAAGSSLLALLLGVAGALLAATPWRGARLAVRVYVEAMRNTPLLVQLFLLYFGIGALLPLNDAGEHLVGRTAWAIIAIGLHYGAFQVEALRAALDGVPVATLEAARALGLQGRELQRWIILPLALRQALPELGNTSVQIVKATAVAYAIAVPELLYAANRLWADNGNVAQMMPVLLLSYLLLVLAVTWLQRRLERHFRIPGEVGA
ncbi:amino acid ABC transporter permease [Pseudomonas citronellolis]|jgi:polar amino acid transport system permease protein|uniref:amino acid ABC transporter permease n=1 Tax=Pseudomonas citronellolis TaxID=53408 RepID=UPI000853130E|nr:ABC transporter permease subunit [Pseudomonas humi]